MMQRVMIYSGKLRAMAISPHHMTIAYSAENLTIPAEGKALVKTDIAMAIPDGCYGRIG